MASPAQFEEVGSAIIKRLLTGGILAVGILLLIGIIVGVFFLVAYWRKFNIKVRIKTKRGTGADGMPVYKIYYDKGGVLRNKLDRRSFFRILKEKVDLPCPPYEALQILASGGNELEVIKESDREYYYNIPGKMETGYVLKEGVPVKIEKQETRVVDSDVAYWNQLRKRETRKMFDPEGLFFKILPYAVPILMVMGVVFYTYVWLDKSPQIIAAAKEVAEQLAAASNALKDIQIAQTATCG